MPFEESTEFPLAPTKKNPVGLYRKTFTVKDSMLQKNGKVYITLGGVESAYYLYINGKEIGYSEDSYDPHTFDITDALNDPGKENVLAVKVYKFCDGTWMEDQDMIYDGGIFRDVYLTSTPTVHVQDYTLATDLSDDYSTADLKVKMQTINDSATESSNMAAQLNLYDDQGNLCATTRKILQQSHPVNRQRRHCRCRLQIQNFGTVIIQTCIQWYYLCMIKVPNFITKV